MNDPDFRPRGLLANTHFQSILSSSALRRRRVQAGARQFLDDSQPWLMDGGEDVTLQAYFNPNPAGKGLVVMFHGWEGSAASNYLVATAAHFHGLGFEILRLNFRDHGDSHHLNQDIFHSCRLDEVVHAVADAQRRIGTGPMFLCGFSLGGNFALRVALAAPAAGIDIQRCFAVSPVISPHQVLDALEDGMPLYQYYFSKKWRRSLRYKQDLFPAQLDLDDWYRADTLRVQTDILVQRFTDFGSTDNYLSGYAIGGDTLAGLKVSASLITTEDDPVVPIEDYRELPDNPCLDLTVLPLGGHCGYLRNWRLDSWIEHHLGHQLLREVSEPSPREPALHP